MVCCLWPLVATSKPKTHARRPRFRATTCIWDELNDIICLYVCSSESDLPNRNGAVIKLLLLSTLPHFGFLGVFVFQLRNWNWQFTLLHLEMAKLLITLQLFAMCILLHLEQKFSVGRHGTFADPTHSVYVIYMWVCVYCVFCSVVYPLPAIVLFYMLFKVLVVF